MKERRMHSIPAMPASHPAAHNDTCSPREATMTGATQEGPCERATLVARGRQAVALVPNIQDQL